MIRAKTIMTENVITIKETATIKEASKLIVSSNVYSLLVTKNNLPIAIVTKRYLIKGAINKNLKNPKVKNVMNKEFITINPDTNYSFIIKKLRNEKIRTFPVVENDKLVGIITETDIMNSTRDFTRFHQITQEIILVIFGLVTAFFLFFFSPFGQSFFNV